jgi:cell division protein FtsQ
MWDSAGRLNAIANVLIALALALLAWALAQAAIHSPRFPLRQLSVQGELHHLDSGLAEAAARSSASGTFFSVDLEAVRRSFEALPWVRKAEVRRVWPDRLDVVIEEHVALARWGADMRRLVNSYGEVFAAASEEAASLPQFAGPAGTAQEVTRRYAAYRQALSPLSLDLRQVLLSPRFAWQLRLSNGLTLELGRDQLKEPVLERLARFVAFYARTVGSLNRRLDYVDLRYPNGFAVRVPESIKPAPNMARPSRPSRASSESGGVSREKA